MGDTGSLLIGLINSILVIKFINVASDPSSLIPLNSAPVLGFAILIVPLFDTLRVVSLRIINRRSPFWPDRNHIHHLLLDIGFSHKSIVLTCVAANLFFISIAYIFRFAGALAGMLVLTATSVLLVSIVYYFRHKRKMVVTKGQLNEKPILHSHKIFTFSGETIAQD
jgi:hypothetical protein